MMMKDKLSLWEGSKNVRRNVTHAIYNLCNEKFDQRMDSITIDILYEVVNSIELFYGENWYHHHHQIRIA